MIASIFVTPTGHIPTQLGNLTMLKELWLESNQLTGKYQAHHIASHHHFGWNRSLRVIASIFATPTGHIPTELGNLTMLTELDLNSNLLTGKYQEHHIASHHHFGWNRS